MKYVKLYENFDNPKVKKELTPKINEELEEEESNLSAVTLDIPLFIRLLEWAREDSTDDVQLHVVAENIVKIGEKTLTMEDYEGIIKLEEELPETPAEEEEIPAEGEEEAPEEIPVEGEEAPEEIPAGEEEVAPEETGEETPEGGKELEGDEETPIEETPEEGGEEAPEGEETEEESEKESEEKII